MSTTYGYIRVSTLTQHDDRQWAAMDNFGVDRECIFADKQSGKDFDRPAYAKLMQTIKPGDTIVIKSIDRLGRNYDEMLEQLNIITKEKEAYLAVIDLPLLDTRNKYGDALTGKLISNLVIQIFSYVAKTERNMNQQRTKEGLKAAKARGVKLGRKSLAKSPDFEYYFNLWENGQISEREAARQLNVARGTFHKWAHEFPE